MSYDLHLFPRGRVDEFLQRWEEQDEDSAELNPGPVVAEREAWKGRVRHALVVLEPRFTAFVFGFGEIAQMYSITEAEARVRFRHIELNLPDEDTSGVQVTIADETVDVTVAYWHTGTAAAQVFEKIWGYLKTLESEGQLATYDPQLDRELDLSADFETVLARYLSVMEQMPQILAESSGRAKPWWKFW